MTADDGLLRCLGEDAPQALVRCDRRDDFVVPPGAAVADAHGAAVGNVDDDAVRQGGHVAESVTVDLVGDPPRLPGYRVPPGWRVRELALAVAPDEHGGHGEVVEQSKRLCWERPAERIARDDHQVDIVGKLGQDGGERRRVAVDVGQHGDAVGRDRHLGGHR
jgi:hypothetical protein